MSDPYIGEIRMFAGTFNPRGWAFCDGQLLQVSQNDALFSLLGTIYGGDGRTTFALPDLRGRIPIHEGQGAGLSNRRLGSRGGSENVTLTANQLPSHSHALYGRNVKSTSDDPAGRMPAITADDIYHNAPEGTFSSQTVTNTGGGGSHVNLQPALCLNFIIALVGQYPPRT